MVPRSTQEGKHDMKTRWCPRCWTYAAPLDGLCESCTAGPKARHKPRDHGRASDGEKTTPPDEQPPSTGETLSW
jgi:hypothetical protein